MSDLERMVTDLTGPGGPSVETPLEFELEDDEIDLADGVHGTDQEAASGEWRHP
jgi:hypothetical protein